MATSKELRAQAQELMDKANQMEAEEQQKLFDGIVDRLSKAGYTIQDFISHMSPKSSGKKKPSLGSKLPVKYSDGKGNDWTGRGRNPQWLVQAVEAGKKKEDFLVS